MRHLLFLAVASIAYTSVRAAPAPSLGSTLEQLDTQDLAPEDVTK